MENTRLYHVVAINEKTGKKEYCTAYAVPHKDACTILSKFPRGHEPGWRHVRMQLEEST